MKSSTMHLLVVSIGKNNWRFIKKKELKPLISLIFGYI